MIKWECWHNDDTTQTRHGHDTNKMQTYLFFYPYTMMRDNNMTQTADVSILLALDYDTIQTWHKHGKNTIQTRCRHRRLYHLFILLSLHNDETSDTMILRNRQQTQTVVSYLSVPADEEFDLPHELREQQQDLHRLWGRDGGQNDHLRGNGWWGCCCERPVYQWW